MLPKEFFTEQTSSLVKVILEECQDSLKNKEGWNIYLSCTSKKIISKIKKFSLRILE